MQPIVPNFSLLGRWDIEVYVDGAPQLGQGVAKPLTAIVAGEGASSTITLEQFGVVAQFIPDGVERQDSDGYTRYFYLAPDALAHTHRRDNYFDSDVCVPAADGKTLHCRGVTRGPDGILREVVSVWRKIGA